MPVIGITAYRGTNPLADMDMDTAFLPGVYVEAVRRSGGIPVLLPPGSDSIRHLEALRVVERVDGIIVPGGPDLNPHLYGTKPEDFHPLTQASDVLRDQWEILITRSALMLGVPFLGICRGMQVLNVVRGGTLHQHLEHAELHGNGGQPGYGTHQVHVLGGTILAKITGPGRGDVPTRHHQGVAKLGHGLEVSAFHQDGTVEAAEMPGRHFVVGVQWHPERDSDQKLFNAFMKAAAGG
jgi:gamma-glutamyl-gamma-aminobutyrate hydrolase PuuD